MKRLIGLVITVFMLIASAAFGGIAIEDKSHRKMEVAGEQLFLVTQGNRTTAPDGKYFLGDNSFLLVVNGKIDKAKSSALKGHPDIAAEVGAQTSKGLHQPGAARMFNPQPEPPGAPIRNR